MRLLSRSFIAVAAAFALAAASLHAQDSKPAAAPAKEEAKKPVAKQEAQEASAKEAKKPASAKERTSRRQQDARHCLEQPNNTAIIKCAEAYL